MRMHFLLRIIVHGREIFWDRPRGNCCSVRQRSCPFSKPIAWRSFIQRGLPAVVTVTSTGDINLTSGSCKFPAIEKNSHVELRAAVHRRIPCTPCAWFCTPFPHTEEQARYISSAESVRPAVSGLHSIKFLPASSSDLCFVRLAWTPTDLTHRVSAGPIHKSSNGESESLQARPLYHVGYGHSCALRILRFAPRVRTQGRHLGFFGDSRVLGRIGNPRKMACCHTREFNLCAYSGSKIAFRHSQKNLTYSRP